MMLAKNVSESHRDPNICVCTVQKRINREEATVRLTSRQENIKMVKTFSPTVQPYSVVGTRGPQSEAQTEQEDQAEAMRMQQHLQACPMRFSLDPR